MAKELNVSPMAVGHWETGSNLPKADHVAALASILDMPVAFFATGRPYTHVSEADAHFRSLRRTPARERKKATTFVEQMWELTHALEKRVQLPEVDMPGFIDGEATPVDLDPAGAARMVRRAWGIGPGPIPRVVRTMEKHGIVVTLIPFAGDATATIDAFSTSRLPRPVAILTPERACDVFRHRFTAAHELGHLVLHGEASHGDVKLEKEADEFAAEFLTPAIEITPRLPARLNLQALDKLSKEWGVSIESLIYRCRELGIISEAVYRRAFQRLNQLRKVELFVRSPVEQHPGEVPAMLQSAYRLAQDHGLTLSELADELAWKPARVRALLGYTDQRPKLQLV
ncbi:XRE family transcriptional regulator [Arthrobacter ginkgonis]|uniref:XRE family transcriptional regulator n=1 Tax=Arthrobacter ginkgonis TaxID=1630594 RepID=A0ABP7BPP7_9MICC